MKHARLCPALLLLVFTQTGCLSNLAKYSRQNNAAPVASTSATTAAAAPAATKRTSVAQISEGVFRIALPYDRTWDSLVDILLKNYNLQIVDRQSGILTTEWDSYYLDGKVHRNKLSLRIKRLGTNGVDLTIHNNVEVLSRLPDGGVAEVWLPTDRVKPEIGRIVQNLAIASGLPKPQLSADYNPPTAQATQPM